MFWDRRISFQPAYPHKAEGRTTGENPPDKTESIKKLIAAVKLVSTQSSGKICGKEGSGYLAAWGGGKARLKTSHYGAARFGERARQNLADLSRGSTVRPLHP